MKYFVQGITRLDDARTNVRQVGEFATHDEAIAACRRMIDDFLAREHKAGMNAALLFGRYQRFGESPFIFGEPGHPYTWGLLGSMPRLVRSAKMDLKKNVIGNPRIAR